jgi:CP family cyanate transporter-like MFS transporter
MMQGVGYGIGSSGTLLVGQLHQSTGSFAAAGVLFMLVGSLAAVFGYRAGRDRYIGD